MTQHLRQHQWGTWPRPREFDPRPSRFEPARQRRRWEADALGQLAYSSADHIRDYRSVLSNAPPSRCVSPGTIIVGPWLDPNMYLIVTSDGNYGFRQRFEPFLPRAKRRRLRPYGLFTPARQFEDIPF